MYMKLPYSRYYENKARKYVDGKRYRLGNPRHPEYAYYKYWGMEQTLKYMGITEVKSVAHSNSRVGDLSEFYSITWLWDQGYEVFPNAGSQGLVDMIAWHPVTGETILIDVKTSRKTKFSKNDSSTSRSPLQIEKGIQILSYNADTRKLKFVRHRDEQSS